MRALTEITAFCHQQQHSVFFSSERIGSRFDRVVRLFRASDGLPPHLAEDLLLQLGVRPAGRALIFDVCESKKDDGEEGRSGKETLIPQ